MNDKAIIKIEKVVYGGQGMGYLDGKVCFVPDTIAGETVEVKILKSKKNFIEAKLLNIREKSTSRTEPQCEHTGLCGGCQYQHMNYTEELRSKTEQVRNYLNRQIGLPEEIVHQIEAEKEPFYYRQHFTAHATKDKKLGYIAKDNRTVFPVNHCPLLEKDLNGIWSTKEGSKPKRTFRLANAGKIHKKEEQSFFQVCVGDQKIWTHSRSFFQANRNIAAKIGAVLKKEVQSVNPAWFADLYSGVGLFSILAAKEVPNLFLVEENKYSIEALEMNFAHDDPRQVIIAEDQVENVAKNWFAETETENVFIFLDPPREGLKKELAQELAQIDNQPAMAYLSCHLGALARDLKIITSEGNWQIEKVIPFDMFPRTKHIETLTLLTPKS